MRKRALALVFASLLSACSAGGGNLKSEIHPPPPVAEPSPEEDPLAPGMIPKNCELLLNQAKDQWGYVAGGNNNWKPASSL